jgi:hypothetical protein
MRVLYTSGNEAPAIMALSTLISNFDANGGWHPSRHREAILADMRHDLEGLGWYENLHDNGRYVVINLDKFQLTPTPEGWDGLYATSKNSVSEQCRRNGHRDTGRGVCAECGEFL